MKALVVCSFILLSGCAALEPDCIKRESYNKTEGQVVSVSVCETDTKEINKITVD